MALKDTLKRLHAEHAENVDFETSRMRLLREWQQDIADVLAAIRTLLNDYEADGSVTFKDRPIQISEESIGSYQTVELTIVAGSAAILVRPVARLVVGGNGRLDMFRQGRQAEDQRLILLRQSNAWTISLPPDPGSLALHPFASPQPRRFAELTRDTLEQALDCLLR